MDCPSRIDPIVSDERNQNPDTFASKVTTRSNFGQIANARLHYEYRLADVDSSGIEPVKSQRPLAMKENVCKGLTNRGEWAAGKEYGARSTSPACDTHIPSPEEERDLAGTTVPSRRPNWQQPFFKAASVLRRYAKFVGPGFMISVAYIDPGNYATDVAAGASYRFQLLFMILLSNIFAIFLQFLCIKLGSVTGLNLAEMSKAHFPRWLNYVLYFFAESAIIATDIAEVIGTAIALNLLLNVPLVAGCAISIVDVLVILAFYRPNGRIRGLRLFELFVALLVLGVVICFCYQLSLIGDRATAREIFRGYAPSSALIESRGLYQACGILGATVMPHSLYLGSGIVQARLKEYDNEKQVSAPPTADNASEPEEKYRPSISAIRSCLSYSILENSISLFTFALFVNSAILIVAGASLYTVTGADNADLFGIHELLSSTMAPIAGTIFALALLLSGTSAGIVCTIAGQMVSEGQLSWAVKPWVRRLITRSISITPSIVIAGAVGKDGLSAALEGSQVALSVILPFVSAPLIFFTCSNKFMAVAAVARDNAIGGNGNVETIEALETEGAGVEKFANNWVTTVAAGVIWLMICVMNVALLVLAGKGIE